MVKERIYLLIFENETETFAILLAADLNNVSNPLSSVKEMVNFAYQFSETSVK